MYCLLLVLFVFVYYVLFDCNYFVRLFFSYYYGHFFHTKCRVDEDTTIYGIGTFLDCDVWFGHIRVARLVRELDFARSHYYKCSGIYDRAISLGIHSLQGSTFTYCDEPIPLFAVYKIDTKLVYWDEGSFFLEHKVTTINDGRVRHILISRQVGIGKSSNTSLLLLEGLPGSNPKPKCPENITHWMNCMEVSSKKLRPC